MFTGIIESLGIVKSIIKQDTNITFNIESPISKELKIDQSIVHNGVCLTVINKDNNTHQVTAIEETLLKSNLKNLNIGDKVNLERCMKADGRFDGHIVQGHIDTTCECINIEDMNGSWIFKFSHQNSKLLVDKGSVTINGVSLTLVSVSDKDFSVAIIPYTFENTIFHELKVGQTVNIEFDIIGKYVAKMLIN